MPSHISHYLFASDLVQRTLPAADAAAVSADFDSFLCLGAQGPDLFLHNRRRRPSGITYGMVLHRKSAGRFCASLVETNRHKPLISPEGAYTIGWLSHVVLDRILHPYINYRAGWVIPKHPETYHYRVNHVFLERTIDVLLLREKRNMQPEEFDFASKVEVDPGEARGVFGSVREALVSSTRRGENDSDLSRRIRNAYLDAVDYYHAINTVDRRRARMELEFSDEELPFWLGIYHPICLPRDIDFGNRNRSPWRHPCSGEFYSTESVDDMYARGLGIAEQLVRRVREAWEGSRRCFDEPPLGRGSRTEAENSSETDTSTEAENISISGTGETASQGNGATMAAGQDSDDPEVPLERLIGNGDLSDERLEGEPCRRTTFSVLDFPRALREIRSEIMSNPYPEYRPG